MDNEVVPTWLPGFLEPANEEHKDRYFAVCKEHGATYQKDKRRKDQKNYYCVDCEAGPLCEKGFKADHGGHTVLQVRKDSWHDAVRIGDISPLFNIDHIQKFRINGNDVVFLPSRPQAKPTKDSPSHCDVCGRSLIHKPARFCSLSCKVKAIYRHPRGNSHPVPTKQTTTSSSKTEKDAPAMPKKKRTRSPSEKDLKKDAPTVPKKPRSRSSRKPVSLEDPSLNLVSSMDKLSIAKESTDAVLSSHPGHNTNDVSSGHASSSPQEPLETKFTGYPKGRKSKGESQRARSPDPVHLFSDWPVPDHSSKPYFLEPRLVGLENWYSW